jgi:outer membrane biosynthesis protein TonB
MANPIKIISGAARAMSKSKKPSLKAAKKAKPLANPKSNVKVLPRKTAPKSGLENRGAKLTKSQRSERAQDYKFDKSLESYFKGLDDRMGTAPVDYYAYKKNLRGPGKANSRKAAALDKEGKSVVKINSQRNLKKK